MAQDYVVKLILVAVCIDKSTAGVGPVGLPVRFPMAHQNTTDRCYEWRIALEVSGTEMFLLRNGDTSTSVLGDLFAQWLSDRGDLGTWDDARRFGNLIAQYSDLRTDVVAVWLGLDPERLSAPPAPEGQPVPDQQELCWHFEGPNGNPMVLERTIDD